MPFEFQCPHCGNQSWVDDNYLGKSGPCIECGQTIHMPAPPPSPDQLVRQKRWCFPHTRGQIFWFTLELLYLACVFVFIFWLESTRRTPNGNSSRLSISERLARVTQLVAGDPVERFAVIECQFRVDRITRALRQYHREYGRFPPSVVRNDRGEPLYSWRVLILPQLGLEGLYNEFDLSRPWDSPQNIALVAKCPEAFRCYKDVDASIGGFTSYLLVTGTNTAYALGNVLPLDQLEQAAGNQILVVERANSGIVWSQPGDADIATLEMTINSSPNGLRGRHNNSVVVGPVLGDSEVWRDDTAENTIRERMVFSGDE